MPIHNSFLPTLRFPEFREAGEWVERKLGEIISLEYGSPLPEQKRNGGLIPVVGSNGIVGYHDNALVNAPAIVVGRKGSAGQINWIVSDCYPIDTTFYVKNKDSQNYLMFFLKLTLEKSKLEDFKDNGAVPGINRNEIYSIKMALPILPEQQKIAACLSSLDELITAHSQKLDALKKHKKGLMQQLFPAEGETVPTLRFPEFRDAGEWVERKLGEIAPLQRGFDLPSDKIKKGDIPVVYSNGIQNFHNIGMAKAPGLMTGRSGTIGKVHFIEKGNYWPHNTSLWVTNFNGNFPKFIYYLYININIARFASGSGVPTLNRNYVHEFHTSLPSSTEEQQKIAACLSSLDELITAHSQKLDALKKHKKGLMQQLFPAVDKGGA